MTQGAQVTMRRTIGSLLQVVVNGVNDNRYLFHDQLGSVVKATDVLGNVVHALDYMPNGARRKVSDPLQVEAASPALTPRGFTGHEHVDGLDLVHMNGRIYDPTLGRFLQPDPVVQAPGSVQGWNAYSYVFNNPLRYTDPTGMLGQTERGWLGAIIMIVAVATQQYWAAEFTGVYGAAMTAGVYAGVGFVSGAVATQSWQGGVYGAFSAALGVGLAGGGSGFGSWAVQTFTGGVVGSLQGGDFGHAFLSAGLSAAFMPNRGQIPNNVTRTVVGAIVGGTISRATGGKFANGAISGAIQGAMASGGRTQGETTAADEYSEDVSPSRAMRRRMQLVEAEGSQEMKISLTLSPEKGIDEATVRSYIQEANAGWNVVIAGDDGITRTFGLNLTYAPRGGNLRLVPCTPSVCTTGLGAANVGGPRMWYSATGLPGTPAHEMGHVFGFTHNRAYGTGSIMSGDLNRSVTQRDFDLLWGAYSRGR